MAITYHHDLIQGSEEWLAARCGLLTASEMKLILTPTLKTAANDKSRAHLWEMAAQRISGHVEPTYIGDDMLRGWGDEVRARDLYAARYSSVQEVGFITNDDWGFTLGYSPDGLVGDDGLIEIKSRRQKFQVQAIATGEVPDEYALQLQTGLLVTGRQWVDFISYSGGLPMFVSRVFPDADMQAAIIRAATDFEGQIEIAMTAYAHNAQAHGYAPTERTVEQEMHMGEAS